MGECDQRRTTPSSEFEGMPSSYQSCFRECITIIYLQLAPDFNRFVRLTHARYGLCLIKAVQNHAFHPRIEVSSMKIQWQAVEDSSVLSPSSRIQSMTYCEFCHLSSCSTIVGSIFLARLASIETTHTFRSWRAHLALRRVTSGAFRIWQSLSSLVHLFPRPQTLRPLWSMGPPSTINPGFPQVVLARIVENFSLSPVTRVQIPQNNSPSRSRPQLC